jgi:hypothetical protein
MTRTCSRLSPGAGPSARRTGFTVTEIALALGALATVAVIVAQLATWSLAERIRTDARLDAVEAATNLLEEARARPWGELTAEWAEAQRLPDHLAQRWREGRLSVRVEPEPERPQVKRVTVEVRCGSFGPDRPVMLSALFAARAAGGGP